MIKLTTMTGPPWKGCFLLQQKWAKMFEIGTISRMDGMCLNSDCKKLQNGWMD